MLFKCIRFLQFWEKGRKKWYHSKNSIILHISHPTLLTFTRVVSCGRENDDLSGFLLKVLLFLITNSLNNTYLNLESHPIHTQSFSSVISVYLICWIDEVFITSLYFKNLPFSPTITHILKILNGDRMEIKLFLKSLNKR